MMPAGGFEGEVSLQETKKSANKLEKEGVDGLDDAEHCEERGGEWR